MKIPCQSEKKIVMTAIELAVKNGGILENNTPAYIILRINVIHTQEISQFILKKA